ncbi:MAG: ATP-binding protein [Candidatus Sericytochromatia bacterium]|nr:ATP-binding protein [Candidatus Tanganyikabacteria bacterium]
MDQLSARLPLETFLESGVDRPTLGLVYGRRRIGKSTLLEGVARERRGFYWEATRSEAAVHLARLGEAVGAHLRVGKLSFDSWEEAIGQLLRLGDRGPVPVVLDEFSYLLEAFPPLDSVLAAALGPGGRRQAGGQVRLVLCGSAIALMKLLTVGEAPLRGRAGMELVMQPFDFRAAGGLLGRGAPAELALRVFSTIGGVVGYYTDMVDHDLPRDLADFDRWVAARVLSPAATLHHEATTVLAEDPTLSQASPALHNAILGAIASGAVTAGRLSNRLRRPVSNLDPALKRLAAAGFVNRHDDPVRAQRPVYSLNDPFLQFHYAILEPHAALLRDRDPHKTWRDHLLATFDSRVRGPVFEAMARSWVRRHADPETTGGPVDHLGASTVVVDGTEHELDVVAATGDPAAPPSERSVLCLGEAKAGQTVQMSQLRQLERARAALGVRASRAKLMLFAPAFSRDVLAEAGRRGDLELIDLERLYGGK